MVEEDKKKPVPAKAGNQKKERYIAATGRRKTSVAQVRLWPTSKKGVIEINQKKFDEYFTDFELREVIKDCSRLVGKEDTFGFTIVVKGGGFRGQAEAARLGIARALVKFNDDYRSDLKKAGFLTRDSRMKERMKPGLKGARRAPQWSKR